MSLCRANIKVSSTETGAIFGNIVYESSAYADRSVVVLNDIHIDIMDYISPASCPDVQFRSMWAEFEWENKVVTSVMPLGPTTSYNVWASASYVRGIQAVMNRHACIL